MARDCQDMRNKRKKPFGMTLGGKEKVEMRNQKLEIRN